MNLYFVQKLCCAQRINSGDQSDSFPESCCHPSVGTTLQAVTVVFIFCLITQAPLDVLDMVARHHEEHLNAFQQPPPLEESHWSQTSEEGSDLHSPVIYEQTFVHEPGTFTLRFPRTL